MYFLGKIKMAENLGEMESWLLMRKPQEID